MAEFHFMRVREKGSSDPFVDPESVITVVFKQAVLAALDALRLMGKGDVAERLTADFYVYYTRLEEDSEPLVKQIDEFYKELLKEDSEVVLTFMQLVATYCFIVFSMYVRRDGKLDKDQNLQLKVSSMFELLIPLLSGSTIELLRKDTEDYLTALYEKKLAINQINAQCVENDKVIRDLKGIVARTVLADPAVTWEEAAAACDRFLNTGKGTDEEQIAASLAYPTYTNPTANVTQTTEENQ